MCKPSSPKIPPPPPPPKIEEPPKQVDPNVQQARTDEKRQAKLAAGRRGTILTSGALDSEEANTAKKTLLGK